MRPQNRSDNEIRPLTFTRNYTKHAEGSVLVEFGDTKVICTASVTAGVPRFMREQNPGCGWLTAEYSMLPRATHERTMRDVSKGKPSGRSVEIQRLIGRSLRQAVDLKKFGENTVNIDCDVIQADGGTRTAAISGACVALVDAIRFLQQKKMIKHDPLNFLIAGVSVGVVNQVPVVDLEYTEDCKAGTDMNVIMTEQGDFVEVQGTAEDAPFSRGELNTMLELAEKGIEQIVAKQKEVLGFVEVGV